MKAALLGWLSDGLDNFDLADFRAALKAPVLEGVLGATVVCVVVPAVPLICATVVCVVVPAVPLLCPKFLEKRVPPRLLVML